MCRIDPSVRQLQTTTRKHRRVAALDEEKAPTAQLVFVSCSPNKSASEILTSREGMEEIFVVSVLVP